MDFVIVGFGLINLKLFLSNILIVEPELMITSILVLFVNIGCVFHLLHIWNTYMSSSEDSSACSVAVVALTYCWTLKLLLLDQDCWYCGLLLLAFGF